MADMAPPRLLRILFAGWVNRHQRDVIQYSRAENRVLKTQLKGHCWWASWSWGYVATDRSATNLPAA